MGKKIIGSVLVIGAAVAGVWYYAAQRFDEQAQIFIARLDSLKPYVTYSKATIDKFRFQIHLSNLSVGTDPNTMPTVEGVSLKNLRLDMNAQTSLFYNPINRTLTIYGDEANNNAANLVFHHGSKATTIRPIIEGKPCVTTVVFYHHPILKDLKALDFLHNIKEFNSSCGKMKYINGDNNKEIFSTDGMDYHAEMNIPYQANSTKDYSFHQKLHYHNNVLHDEIIAIYKDFLDSVGAPSQMTSHISGYFTNYFTTPMNGKSDTDFTSPKEEMDTFITALMEGKTSPSAQLLETFPSLELHINTQEDSGMGKYENSYTIDFKKKDKNAKIGLNLNLTASDKIRPVIAKTFVLALKEQLPSLSITESAMTEMLPDLASLSPIKVEFLTDVSLKQGLSEGDLNFSLKCKDYETVITGKMNLPEISGSLELKNYKVMMKEFMDYIDRVAQNGHSLDGLINIIASIKVLAMTVDHIITQVGVPSEDKSVLTLKGNYNSATSQASINGKPMSEIIGMFHQDQPTPHAAPQASPTQPMVPVPTQPEPQTQPMMPVPTQPGSQAQPMVPAPTQPEPQTQPMVPVPTQPGSQAHPMVPTPTQPEPQAHPMVPAPTQPEPQAHPIVPAPTQPEPQAHPTVPAPTQPEPQAHPTVPAPIQPERSDSSFRST